MDLPAELFARALLVAHDCDPLEHASRDEPRRLILAQPDVNTGDRWLAEVVTDQRGVATARLLPLPATPTAEGAGAWVRTRLRALLDGEPDALSIDHAERAGSSAPEWRGEPRARVMPCARSPAVVARQLERSRGQANRHRHGAFYTSPAEIDLAARCGMFELLAERLEHRSQSSRRRLARWVFAGRPQPSGSMALPRGVAARVGDWIDELVIFDPACGAGSFLVGALQVVAELAARAASDAGRTLDEALTFESLASRTHGTDIDADALELARTRLQTLTGSPGALVLADALLAEAPPADLVVGNPPYVRHEEVAPPGVESRGARLPSPAAVRRYKARLAAVATARGHPIPARADLYVHFFHLAMDSLRPGGIAAMVLSASWLDLEFARGLRERLGPGGVLRQVHESRSARSFGDADINAVLLVAGASRRGLARFASWTVPFEDGLPAAELGELMSSPAGTIRHGDVTTRVVEVANLDPATGWGGPYLRAPAVHDRFRASEGLVRLSTLATVRFGLKTGANDFFYIDAERAQELRLPASALRPMLTSARECQGYVTSTASVRRQVLSCHDTCADRGEDELAAYLARGRADGVHRRRSVASRRPWWSLGQREPAQALLPRRIGERFACFENDAELLEDNNLFGIDSLDGVDLELLLAATNCTWTRLSLELVSRPLTGAQPLIDTNVYIVRALQVPDLQRAAAEVQKECIQAWRSLRARDALPIQMECEHEDRRALDRAVLRHLGAAPAELADLVEELHQEVIDMVSTRLRKANRPPQLHG